MNRNEITLQEMFSSVIRELREGGRWGTAHIYQSAVNAFSAFTKWQPMPMRRLSPTVLKRFENFLRQRNCSWNTVSTYIKTVRSVYNRAVDRKYIRYVPRLFEHVYTGTRADKKKALKASDISSLVRETERSLQGGTLPNAQQRTRIFFVLMFMLRGIPFVETDTATIATPTVIIKYSLNVSHAFITSYLKQLHYFFGLMAIGLTSLGIGAT